MLRDFIALPILILVGLSILCGEKWKEEHERAEEYKKELEECLMIRSMN